MKRTLSLSVLLLPLCLVLSAFAEVRQQPQQSPVKIEQRRQGTTPQQRGHEAEGLTGKDQRLRPSLEEAVGSSDTAPGTDTTSEGPLSAGAAAVPGSPAPAEAVLTGSLAPAWQDFQAARYEHALRQFQREAGGASGAVASEARLGFAYSAWKLHRLREAADAFKLLVRQRYRVEETGPALMRILVTQGRWREARRTLAFLSAGERAHWQRLVDEAALAAEFTRARDNTARLKAFLDRYEARLGRCLHRETFLRAAQALATGGEKAAATPVLELLLTCCAVDDPLRLEVLRTLAPLLPPREAVDLLARETERPDLPSSQRDALMDLRRDTARAYLGSLEPSATDVERAAHEVLALAPGDPGARTMLGWYAYSRGDFAAAEEIFAALQREYPEDMGHGLGLGYCQMQLDREEEALAWAEAVHYGDDPRWRELLCELHKKAGLRAYQGGDLARADSHLRQALAMAPEDHETRLLLGWTLVKERQHSEAIAAMLAADQGLRSAASAQAVLAAYEAAALTSGANDFAQTLAAAEDPALKQVAGDYYFRRERPVTAAGIVQDPGNCYHNATSPRAESFFYGYRRTGDDGTSLLREWAFPQAFHVPLDLGGATEVSATVTPRHLSAGGGPDIPYAGSHYRWLNGEGRKQQWVTSDWVVQPDIGLEREGDIRYEAHVGSTPLGGPVSALPTFSLHAAGDAWQVNVHQLAVKDSLLSFIGNRDPYGSEEFGRVVRAGAAGRLGWQISNGYWAALGMRYDHYYGRNVAANDAVGAEAAVGKTFPLDTGEFSTGLFASVEHFTHDLNHYTFGNGGYFSPQLFFMAGPFARYRSRLCSSGWIDAQGSIGYQFQETGDEPHYPLFDGTEKGYGATAREDLAAEYAGERKSRLGFGGRVQAVRLLGSHWALGAFASIDNAADFTEWQAGLGLHYFWEPQEALWRHRDMHQDFGEGSNR